MKIRLFYLFIFLFLGALAIFLFKPNLFTKKRLDNTKEIAQEVERQTVKRFTPQQLLTEAVRLGDSLTGLADSLAVTRIKAGLGKDGIAQAPKFYPPQNYPEIQTMAKQYGMQPERRLVAVKDAKNSQAEILNQESYVYSKPIFLKDQSCLRCHGKEVPVADKIKMHEIYPKFVGYGHNLNDQVGIWYITIPRKEVLKSLTLKPGKDQRIRSLFKKK